MKKLVLTMIVTTLLGSGCSLLRYQYGDRSKIEQDTTSTPAPIIDGHTGKVISSKTSETNDKVITTSSSSKVDEPLITEDNVVTNQQTTNTPLLTQNDTVSKNDSIVDEPKEKASQVVEKTKVTAEDTKIIQISNGMIAESYSTIPNGSVVYVEVITCDPPLQYDTSKLTTSVEATYSASGKYKMATKASINALRSKLEYRDVANGDWGSLATLARAQKYDYVFYGAIGEQNSKKYLTYYIIKVSNGEIVWENTKIF